MGRPGKARAPGEIELDAEERTSFRRSQVMGSPGEILSACPRIPSVRRGEMERGTNLVVASDGFLVSTEFVLY
jgi:hypothetical protein